MTIDLDVLISDAEIARVHGHANFGPQPPREVVNEGVRKYAVGYQGGYTQLMILLEHGLITTPRPGSYDANLTKKGKKYARALYQIDKQNADAIARERDGLREALVAVISDCELAASACDSEGPRKGFLHIANDARRALQAGEKG